MKKCYVLDTNVLIDDPEALFKFEGNDVAVVDVTITELDGLKRSSGETGQGARKALRNIAAVLSSQSLSGGEFKIIDGAGSRTGKPDDMIINSIVWQNPEQDVIEGSLDYPMAGEHKSDDQTYILVTNDVAMQIKGMKTGLIVEEYKGGKISQTNYKGYRSITIPDEDFEVITSYYSESKNPEYDYIKNFTEDPFVENEYVHISCGNMSVDFRVSNIGRRLTPVSPNFHPYKVRPRNLRQKMALDALNAPSGDIPLVILKGPAGCAKTFLSLAAGLDKQHDGEYNRVIISRNNVLSDKGLGYLKGTLEDKMDPLLAPFYDNLETILRGDSKESMEQIHLQIKDLKTSGALEIASMAYMRGRSITKAFIIIDEVQNATAQQVLNIITRAGEGTKIVLCGDPDQIDAPYLNENNNGLVYASERMKGSPLCAQITFSAEDSIRSELAYDAAKRMTGHSKSITIHL